MDLELSDDQFAMRDGIRALLDGRFGIDRVRAGFDRQMHAELADAGVFSLIADGFSWADAAVVFEQLGECCVPGPLVACALSGEVATHVEGVPAEDDQALVIEHLDAADSVFRIADDVRKIDAATLHGLECDWPLDPLTPVARVADANFVTVIGGAEEAIAWRRHGAVLTAAYQVGMASRLTAMSVEYAKERVQFDRPIGSFQAIKHLLADMVVRTEVARAAVYAAAAHLDEPSEPDLDLTIGVAKALAGEAAVTNGKTATQVHGGMGFTWEVDVHLYLKRAWVLETHFGGTDSHCDMIAAALS